MAGYPRVTHPSATKLSKSLPKLWQRITPFDLHVLSTPPAFILSQDQTLVIKFFPVQNNLSGYSFRSYCFRFVCFKFLPPRAFTLTDRSLKFLRIFRVALLFSFQGSSRLFPQTQLWYHIISSRLCQDLFYTFCESNSTVFHGGILW